MCPFFKVALFVFCQCPDFVFFSALLDSFSVCFLFKLAFIIFLLYSFTCIRSVLGLCTSWLLDTCFCPFFRSCFVILMRSSVAFFDCVPVLTSSSWSPSAVFTSLLCRDHQLPLHFVIWIRYLLLSLFLLSPFGFVFTSLLCRGHQLPLHFVIWVRYFFHFSCWVPSALCLLLYFAIIIACVCFILWLCFGTYFFLLSPFSCVFTSLLCSDRQLRLLHSLIVIRYLLLHFYFLDPFSCASFFNLLWSWVAFPSPIVIGNLHPPLLLVGSLLVRLTSLLCFDHQLHSRRYLIVIRYLLLSILLLGSLQLCLDIYFALIISCIRVVLWLCFGTYFFLLKPFSCVYFFTLPWSSAAASFCDLDPILTSFTFPVESLRLFVYVFTLLRTLVVFALFFDCVSALTSSCWVLSAVCLLLFFAVIVSCVCFILWLWYDTYFFHFYFLDPFSCASFFTLLWSSVAFVSFPDRDRKLTSSTFTSWIPSVRLTSLLCFDHQLHSCRSLIVFRYLLLPLEALQLCLLLYFAVIISCRFILWFGSYIYFFHFSCWVPSALCLLLYFAANISCICIVLWLCVGTYFFLLSPFSCVFTSLLCSDRQLRLLHSLIWIRYLLLSILLLGSLQLCFLLYFASDHQLRLLPSPIVIGNLHLPLLLLGSLQLVLSSLLCFDHQLYLVH